MAGRCRRARPQPIMRKMWCSISTAAWNARGSMCATTRARSKSKASSASRKSTSGPRRRRWTKKAIASIARTISAASAAYPIRCSIRIAAPRTKPDHRRQEAKSQQGTMLNGIEHDSQRPPAAGRPARRPWKSARFAKRRRSPQGDVSGTAARPRRAAFSPGTGKARASEMGEEALRRRAQERLSRTSRNNTPRSGKRCAPTETLKEREKAAAALKLEQKKSYDARSRRGKSIEAVPRKMRPGRPCRTPTNKERLDLRARIVRKRRRSPGNTSPSVSACMKNGVPSDLDHQASRIDARLNDETGHGSPAKSRPRHHPAPRPDRTGRHANGLLPTGQSPRGSKGIFRDRKERSRQSTRLSARSCSKRERKISNAQE